MSLSAQEPVIRCDPPAGSLSGLTEAQKKSFLQSQDKLIAGKVSDALAQTRALMQQLRPNTPEQRAIAVRTAEAALCAGESAYAITLLSPMEGQEGYECAARTLLARAYAEQGQATQRDAELAALSALHKQDPHSPAGQLDMFLLETHRLRAGSALAIWYALRPFGAMQTHLFAEVNDRHGAELLRIELNSDDGLQAYFKEKHPELAAKGDRQYSLDAYAPNAKGKPETATIQYYDSAPAYDTVRQRILEIAERAEK